MKFALKGPFKENIYNAAGDISRTACYGLMREIGYHFQGKNEEKSELIFVRPPKGYPRFHLYIKINGDELIFNLHLDQKRPIYKGVPAHAGEYDGEVVEAETERIKQILAK